MDARLEWGGFLGFWLVFFGLGGSIFGFGDMSKNNTTVAIVYDFDGTLAKGNIQENSFIPNLGVQKNYKTPTI